MKKRTRSQKILAVLSAMLLLVCSVPICAAASVPEITNISVEDVQLIQDTNGYFKTDYDGETQTESEEYYYYWYSPTLTVFFADGSSQEIYDTLEWDGEWYDVLYTDDQSAENPWGVGEHTVTAELLGVTANFTVEIVENPIERIELAETAPIQIIEQTNGSVQSKYDPETGEAIERSEYFHYWYLPALTVYFKDNSSQEIYGVLDWNGTHYGVSYEDDQSAETPWGIGEHTVTAELLGVTVDFTVEIIESPVERIEFAESATSPLIEGTHGEMSSEYDEETDSMVEYFKYWYDTPALTVYFQDGSSQAVRGGLVWNGTWYSVETEDDQSAENPWGLGEHTVLLDFLGFKTEYTVEIVETPIESFSLTPDRALIQGIDNPVEYLEVLQFTMTVVMKNGSTIAGSVDEICVQTGYSPDFMYDFSVGDWGVGTHTVTVSFMGLTADVDIDMIENPYESISISGEYEMVITFTKPNGETMVANAISMDVYMGDYGVVGGYIETDKGVYSITFTFDQASSDALNTKNLTAKIGDMTSNTLQTCKWVKAQEIKSDLLYAYYAAYYRDMSLQFDGTLNKTNIDGIAALATHLGGFPWEGELVYEEDTYALISVADVQKDIETYFGIANADLTMANGYDPETDTVKISALEAELGENVCKVTYENGQWVLRGDLLEDDEAPVMEIVMDDAMCIQSIRMDLPSDTPAGDLNGDDKISAVDARWVLQAASGARPLTDAQKAAADLNGDGKVNAVDARWILQIASGARTL